MNISAKEPVACEAIYFGLPITVTSADPSSPRTRTGWILPIRWEPRNLPLPVSNLNLFETIDYGMDFSWQWACSIVQKRVGMDEGRGLKQ
jgi:hypothetical protein